jgi:hypothetical protein
MKISFFILTKTSTDGLFFPCFIQLHFVIYKHKVKVILAITYWNQIQISNITISLLFFLYIQFSILYVLSLFYLLIFILILFKCTTLFFLLFTYIIFSFLIRTFTYFLQRETITYKISFIQTNLFLIFYEHFSYFLLTL